MPTTVGMAIVRGRPETALATERSFRAWLSPRPPLPFGLALGALAFMASLTPSLIPRTGAAQGLVAGIAFMLAYGVVAGVEGTYRWLGFAPIAGRFRRAVNIVLPAMALAVVIAGLFNATAWQNSINRVMGIAPVESARPLVIAAVALATILVLLLVARLIGHAADFFSVRLSRLLPRRVAMLAGFMLAVILSWSLGSGLLQRGVLNGLDASYRELDTLIPPEHAVPVSAGSTGGPNSLIAWDTIGREGRNRIVSAPGPADIAEVTGLPAVAPIRVYVGLNSADTPEERAALALAELIRVGGFDRATLVIATPTGTGWIDPAAMAPLELLLSGDVATVSVQYSYVPSWLSLFTQPEYGVESSRAVFDAVYGHWRKLPRDARPRLYLFGLSLGALNSEQSFEFHDIVGDPFDGALLAGPPYPSPVWREATRKRVAPSPAWLPVVGDQSLFRFANQDGPTSKSAPWGPMRIVYLQYASDPIVFLETETLWRKPTWLDRSRGPDVSPDMRWIPLVTVLQVACDAMIATSTPAGMGHVYAGEHYLEAWLSILGPQGWTEDDLARLRSWLGRHRR